jgi:(p)ppGpp synthase/HD superfamily hydrolase
MTPDAADFAREAHKGQLYGEVPYWHHLCDVAKYSWVDNIIIWRVAFLHDTLEDTDVTYDQLKDNFGLFIADTVQLLTKDPQLTYFENIQAIIDSGSWVAIHVKTADNIANYKHSGKDSLKPRYEKSIRMLMGTLESTTKEHIK